MIADLGDVGNDLIVLLDIMALLLSTFLHHSIHQFVAELLHQLVALLLIIQLSCC